MARTSRILSPKDEKKTQKVNGFTSRAQNPPTGEMVLAALKVLKNDRGVTMASIRKYLFNNFGGFGPKVGKQRREEIKAFMVTECKNGRITMLNTNEAIDASRRVNMLATRFNIVN